MKKFIGVILGLFALGIVFTGCSQLKEIDANNTYIKTMNEKVSALETSYKDFFSYQNQFSEKLPTEEEKEAIYTKIEEVKEKAQEVKSIEAPTETIRSVDQKLEGRIDAMMVYLDNVKQAVASGSADDWKLVKESFAKFQEASDSFATEVKDYNDKMKENK